MSRSPSRGASSRRQPSEPTRGGAHRNGAPRTGATRSDSSTRGGVPREGSAGRARSGGRSRPGAHGDQAAGRAAQTTAGARPTAAAPAAPIAGAAPAAPLATSFAELGLAEDLVAALAARGIVAPFPIQALALPDALARRDVCGRAETGSGKTLAFGLPLLALRNAHRRRPKGLVLVPTRELAHQVRDELLPLAAVRGVRIADVVGGLAISKHVKALRDGVDVLVATPGRLIDLLDRQAIALDEVAALAIDEADRMADMGFMPQIERILEQVTSYHQTMLFSATLDGDVDKLIARHLHDPVRHEVVSAAATVEQMAHEFWQVQPGDRIEVAAAAAGQAARTIVFVRTKRGADRLAPRLAARGVSAAALHGGLRQGVRERTLERFMKGSISTLVATDVAARGIHVDDVDLVLQFDPPADAKTYLHRAGRTARAGRSGTAVMLVTDEQRADTQALQRRLGLRVPLVTTAPNSAHVTALAAA